MSKVRAWLERAIACFNDPEDNGEDPSGVRAELEALRSETPAGAEAVHAAILDVLLGTADPLGTGPYNRARLVPGEPPGLELFHHARGEWVPAAERAAKAAGPPRPTTGGGPRATWSAFAGQKAPSTFEDLEPTFHQKTGAQLTQVVSALIETGELALAEDITLAVLAQRPRFPGHWWCRLGEVQLRRDPPSARATVARALLFAEKWMPAAVSLWLRVEEACGADAETLAVLYVGGRAHGFALEKAPAFGGVGNRRYEKPARAKARFAEKIVPLLETASRETPVDDAAARRALANMLEGFGAVVSPSSGDEVERPRAKRKKG